MKTIQSLSWLLLWACTSLSPLPAQWVQSNVASSANVSALTVLGTSLVAGTDGGGVFRSTNDGETWTERNSGLANLNVLSLAASGINLFAGTSGGGAVFRSTNSGSDWVISGYVFSGAIVNAFLVSGPNLFAGTHNAIYRTTNNGDNWLNAGFLDQVRALVVADTNVLAGTFAGIYLSTNNGTSWNEVDSGLTNADVYALAASGANVFAGTFGGVFLSTNNGISWTERNSGLTNLNILSLAVSGTNLFAGTFGSGVFLSTNNGMSWSAVNSGWNNAYVYALAVLGSNLFAGVDSGGVWRRPLSEIVSSAEVGSLDIPAHFDLHQNYPNPFNSTTIIGFELQSESFVSMKVFDLLGREVATLLSKQLRAGSHKHAWNAEHLSSGAYLYRLTAAPLSGEQSRPFSETKKFVLLR